jgi:hypothetical protein
MQKRGECDGEQQDQEMVPIMTLLDQLGKNRESV